MEQTARRMAAEAMLETRSCMHKWGTASLAENGIVTEDDWWEFRDELEYMDEVEVVEFDREGIFVCFYPEYCPNYDEEE
jgi:hypothetical protein